MSKNRADRPILLAYSEDDLRQNKSRKSGKLQQSDTRSSNSSEDRIEVIDRIPRTPPIKWYKTKSTAESTTSNTPSSVVYIKNKPINIDAEGRSMKRESQLQKRKKHAKNQSGGQERRSSLSTIISSDSGDKDLRFSESRNTSRSLRSSPSLHNSFSENFYEHKGNSFTRENIPMNMQYKV